MKKRSGNLLIFLAAFIALNLFCCPVIGNQTSGCDNEGQAGSGLIIWIAVSFIIGLIAGAFLIYYYSGTKIYSILRAERKKYLHDLEQDERQDPLIRIIFQYIGIVGLLKKSKDDKVKIINNLDKKVAELKAQNLKLKKQYKKDLHAVSEQTGANEYLQISPDDAMDNRENKAEIYFTIPESDGSFKNINAKKIREVDCFYKIEPDDDYQRGTLHFVSGEYDLRALDNIDYYLSPVCEIQNISDRSRARKIQMTAAGSVIKRGDNWIIDGKNKVKIKLVG